ncbi:MAG TPA: SMP-30/gluconolactonase/LRE family protein [Planctomycetota bacterium]|jgi:sugar lactone lactonase YvrE
MTNQPEHCLPIQNAAGESPMWVPEERALYWVDCEGDKLFKLDTATGQQQTFPASLPVTAICRRAKGGWISATKKGLAFWDAKTNKFEFIVDPEEGHADHRCNDAAVDHKGRFWVGTMNQKDLFAPTGSLWRLDPDLKLHKMDTGFAVPNGIAFSPDDKTMYVTDMFHGKIVAYDFDLPSGAISKRRDFAVVPKEAGLPDGLIADAQGYLWSAHWGGSRITRYAPDGRIDREVRLPVAQVTCMAFAGQALNELYITTAWVFLSDDDRKKQPQAGDLFKVKLDVKGLLEPQFAG